MYILKNNEKATPVMVYTESTLIHGQVVTTEFLRVNIWLRTEGAPKYIHMLNAQMIYPGAAVKTVKFDEIFIPTGEIIGFHVAPGVEVELDYDPGEANRMVIAVSAIAGSFVIKSQMRISSQTELRTSLEVARTNWLSLYEAQITNPFLPQMNVQVPMLLVQPEKVPFGLVE